MNIPCVVLPCFVHHCPRLSRWHEAYKLRVYVVSVKIIKEIIARSFFFFSSFARFGRLKKTNLSSQ